MTRKVSVGKVDIGGGSPVSVQSMTNCDTRDTSKLVRDIKAMLEAGADIVRVTVPDFEAAESLGKAKRRLREENADIPIVADIHFDHRLAISAVENGADKIRINPGNIGGKAKIKAVADAARAAGIPIRVGVNAGSLEKDIVEKYGGISAKGLTESALRNAEILEDAGFSDIVLSLKASNVRLCVDAYREISKLSDYPLHIGITEAGTESFGIVKSSVGIGSLLLSGIGDTLRVSLTGDPLKEIKLGRQILEACGLRKPSLEIVSCPTCGRTEVELERIVNEAEIALSEVAKEREKAGKRGLKAAIMGCVVNGPGEAGDADFGAACGKGRAAIFKGGKVVESVAEDEIVPALLRIAREFDE